MVVKSDKDNKDMIKNVCISEIALNSERVNHLKTRTSLNCGYSIEHCCWFRQPMCSISLQKIWQICEVKEKRNWGWFDNWGSFQDV